MRSSLNCAMLVSFKSSYKNLESFSAHHKHIIFLGDYFRWIFVYLPFFRFYTAGNIIDKIPKNDAISCYNEGRSQCLLTDSN